MTPIVDNSPRRIDAIVTGVAYYYLTSLIVVLGAVFGHEFVKGGYPPEQPTPDVVAAMCNWDGRWYARVVEHGYEFKRDGLSSAAFFPLYPVLAKALHWATAWPVQWCLLIVSHGCLIAAFIVAAAYFQRRFAANDDKTAYALLALGLMPAGIFFRMAYSESTFLLTCLLAMYAVERRWPLLVIALFVGLATAARPVGAALLVPLAIAIWERSDGKRQFLLRAALLAPLALWGLAAFMLYLWLKFDDPLAFAVAQYNWRSRPEVPLGERAAAWCTLEPLWSVYVPDSPAYWGRSPPRENPLFSLAFANPIYFAGAALLIALGAWKRWLNAKESLLAAGLLLIPYFTRGYEMCMGSQGRFVSVVFPLYLVVGRLLAACPPALAAALAAIAGLFLGVYAALFATWHFFI